MLGMKEAWPAIIWLEPTLTLTLMMLYVFKDQS